MNDLIQVECYSGYTYAQEPRAFTWRGQRYEVERVVKRWRTPQGPGFRVEVTRDKSQIANHKPQATSHKSQATSHKSQVTSCKSQISRPVDLMYLEVEDKWTLTVQPREC